MNSDRFDRLRIDRTDRTPLHLQIERQFREMIESGVATPGDMVPGDIPLSEMLGVNRWTVRRALKALVDQGLLRRTKRAGTFVTEKARRVPGTVGFFYFHEAAERMVRYAEAMQMTLAREDVDLKIFAFPVDYYARVNLLREVGRKRLNGALVVALNNDACRRAFLDLEKARFPHVRFGNPFFIGELTAPLVCGDDPGSVRACVDHLRWRGHAKIGFVGKHLGSETERAYLALLRGTAAFEARWLRTFEFSTLEAWRKFPAAPAARAYLRENPDLTAALVEHPPMAVDVLREAKRLGRRVPEDLSIMCSTYGDELAATSPPVTGMELSDIRMGQTAAEALLRVMREGPPDEEKVIRLPFTLVERESVAPPRAEGSG